MESSPGIFARKLIIFSGRWHETGRLSDRQHLVQLNSISSPSGSHKAAKSEQEQLDMLQNTRNPGFRRLRWVIPIAFKVALAGVLLSSTAWAEMVTVIVGKANFREAPSTQSAVLYTADRYYTVEVLERTKDWVKTRDFEGDVAWVAAHLVQNKESVVVRVPSAIVRQAPDKNSPIAFKADRGEGMRVDSRQEPWIQVTNADGAKGWVHRDVVWAGSKK